MRSIARHVRLCLAVWLLSWPVVASAQTTPAVSSPARNAVYFEFAGNGIAYSLNFERAFDRRGLLRVGVEALSAGDARDSGSFFAMPVTLSYLGGSGHSHLEIGGGVLFGSSTWTTRYGGFQRRARSGGVLATLTLGYRHQAPTGRIVFRVGFTPFFTSEGVLPWFGVSIGARF